ncbi:hypothetical protein GH714_037122 [Hevea brasiliensis]|uniref:Uncharacterized protein n=1 Tax=Hevea brasiliensis TaxID=3981 RepID=A0A6A6KDV5_HEVBR|nr:hypothetical protein GH714_037122 [Hevea brasiliensis]
MQNIGVLTGILCMAAAIALSTTLCGVRFRRRSEPKSSDSPNIPAENCNSTTSPLPSDFPPLETTVESQDRNENEAPERTELPLPPAKQLRETFSYNNLLTKSMSTRNIGKNMSLKIPRTMSMARRDREDKNIQKKKGKLKHEDSVWMKTIILGEKCKVPDEDEPVIYDGKGNRISTYHPKLPGSLSISRQNSFVDVNAIPSQQREKREIEKKQDDFS